MSAASGSASRTIFFVRHGQSQANAGGVTMGHAEIPLTETGRTQAQHLADSAAALPVDPPRVLSSPFVRARETAWPYVQRTGRALELEPLLQEFDMIDPALIAGMDQLQRRPVAEEYWQAADPDLRMGDQAETFREFCGRITRFKAEVAPTLPDGTVCFGHGFWIAMLAWQSLGFTHIDSELMLRFRKFQTGLPVPNTSAFGLVEASPGTWFFKAMPAPGQMAPTR